ncbi:MAG: sugar phosphate isomerase/epimerase [Clostridia bacterium]|nr:sugar phosphate isomerase/epimerase [Clostridia bacterium]
MIIAGRTQLLDSASYPDAVRRLSKLGYDGIEVGIYDRTFTPREAFFRGDFPETILRAFEENNVRAWSVGAHMDYTQDAEHFEAVEKAISVARKISTKIVIISGPFKNAEEPFEIQWKRQIEALQHLSDTAEREGIYLAVEYEPGFVIDNHELLLQAFSEVGSSALRVNADIGHFFLLEKDPIGTIETLRDLIVHAHVENMKTGIHNHHVPYEGDMDLRVYFRKLREIGFDGIASFDAYQYDYEAVSEKSVRYFKNLLREIEKDA